MTTQLVSPPARRSYALLCTALVALASTASAQTAAPAPAAPAPAASTPATAPAAEPTAPAAAAEPSAPAPVVGAVEPSFPTPTTTVTTTTTTTGPSSADVEASTGTISVTSVSAPAAEPVVADPNAASVSFKPGKGVDIKSADGNFLLNTRLRFQILDELHAPAAKASKTRNGLVLRRIRLTFGGHIFTKDIKYKLDIALGTPEMGREPVAIVGKSRYDAKTFTDVNGNMTDLSTDRDVVTDGPIQDAYLEFTQIRDLNLHVGQSKIPYSLERLTSDGDMRAIDRSIASSEFSFDRDIGIDVRSADFLGIDKVRYYAGIYSGEGKNATLKSSGGGDLGLIYAARVEMFPMGTFDLYDAPDLARSSDAKLALGLAYAFMQADATSQAAKQSLGSVVDGPASVSVVDFNAHNFTADLTLKVAGFSAMTAFYMRKVEPFNGVRDGIGWSIGAGYVMSEEMPLEVQAGFAMVRPMDRAESSISELNELGGGFNYYFYGHALKLQAEYAHLWDELIPGGADNRVRVQLQASL